MMHWFVVTGKDQQMLTRLTVMTLVIDFFDESDTVLLDSHCCQHVDSMGQRVGPRSPCLLSFIQTSTGGMLLLSFQIRSIHLQHRVRGGHFHL